MSNAFGNYNEIFFAQEALLVLHKALGMAGRVFRGYDPSPQAYGDTIRLRRPTAFTAANAPAAATDLNPDSVTVTLDQWKEVKFLLTDKDLSLTRPRIIADHITPAAYALADAIDQAGAALYKKIPYGNQASSTFALSDITAAHQGMFNNKVPMNDSANLHAMVGGSMQANILNKLTATTASARISLLSNHSSSLPLSSMICSAPTQTTSKASPTVSMGSLRMGVSRLA